MKTAGTATRPSATRQSLTAKSENNMETSYKDINGNEVNLSLSILNDYLAPGGNFTLAEAYVYLNLCKIRRLNPLEKDCFLVRYGGKPQIVIGKETYTKRAQRNPNYQGRKSGIVVITSRGEMEYRKGSLLLEEEKLVGGWCDVNVKGYIDPVSAVVSFKEYCQRDADGLPLSTWKTKPCTMIQKVAVVHALRDAFPDDLGGMYCAEELGMVEVEDNTAPVNPYENAQEAQFSDVDEETGALRDEEVQSSFFGDGE